MSDVRWCDGLVVTTRPDGRLRVVVEAAATEDERDRAEELGRFTGWLGGRDAAGSAPAAPVPQDLARRVEAGEVTLEEATLRALPPELRRRVGSGEMTPGEALGLAVKATQVGVHRSEAVLAVFGQIAALQAAYAGVSTVGEALERAWWDGRFDEPGDPPIGDGADDDTLTEIVSTWFDVAERIGGQDDRERVAARRLFEMRGSDRRVLLYVAVFGAQEIYATRDGSM